MTDLLTGLLWFAALSCGLMAGVYFAFSTFIMTALGQVDEAAGIAVMNAINRVILRSLFMPLFLGSTIASLLLVVIALTDLHAPGAAAMLLGGILYPLGMFLVTMIRNVPLNNALIRAESASDGGAALWARFQRDWARWNHVRTVASTGASALFILAIIQRAV